MTKNLGHWNFWNWNTEAGTKKIQTFCWIGSAKKLGAVSLIFGNFKSPRKVLLNHAECIEI